MQFQNFTLDEFQEDAIKAIDKNQSVLVSAPTGSGKTLIADYVIDKDIKENKRIIYTAPIKALSNQKFKDFTEQYGEEKIGLITGDVVINPTASVLIMTTEVYRNMAIMNDTVLDGVSYCVMDEIHFISDEERGYIWEESIIFSPKHIRFLFLSATIPNRDEFAGWVESIKEHDVKVIKHHVRSVPLERLFYDVELGITGLDSIREKKELDKYPVYDNFGRGRCRRARIPFPDFTRLVEEIKEKDELPCIYFVFSRAKTQDYALKLMKSHNFLTPEEHKQSVSEVAASFRAISKDACSLKSAQLLRQCLPKGIGFHHAGILPDMKHIVEKLFSMGLIKVLFATETFAVGINMPAKTVCFDNLRKYTGTGFRYLNSKEYFQISGRAGRRGIDKKGLSISIIHRPSADLDKIEDFTKEDKLPLISQFKLTYNTVLNLLNLHSESEVQKILAMNFYTYQQLKGKSGDRRVLSLIKARFANVVKLLLKLNYVKDGELTNLGLFATRIFSNEIEISQAFAGEFKLELDEYSILLILFAIVYEPKKDTTFYELFKSKKTTDLLRSLDFHPVLKNSEWIDNIENMTAIVELIYQQKGFLQILKNTNLLEGDLIRLFMQVLDKLEQIDKALIDKPKMTSMVRNCKYLIKESLKGIHMF